MEEYVSSFRDIENVYYLNTEGRERVGATKVCKKTPQARHYIMRNSLFMSLGRPSTWRTEMELGTADGSVRVVADALYVMNKQYNIIEVDNTQKMSVNKTKIDKYRELISLGCFEVEPKFIWVTLTDYRKKRLEKLCEGLKAKIFTIHDLH